MLYIQGVKFKSAHFLIFLRNTIKRDSIKIFTPNKKNKMELWNKSPHFTWNSCHQPRIPAQSSLIYGEGTWPQPPCWVWPCRPWWTLPEMIKFAWEYAVLHYSKSPVQKIQEYFDLNFFLSNFHFFRGCKNCRKLENCSI